MFEFDLGSTFNYAEMASLIAPRPFMVERGHFDGVGSDEMVELSAELTSLTKKPILVKPNAGSPRFEYSTGQTHYDQKPEDFASDILKMIDNGVKIVGGCCGTTAEHIALLRSKIVSL